MKNKKVLLNPLQRWVLGVPMFLFCIHQVMQKVLELGMRMMMILLKKTKNTVNHDHVTQSCVNGVKFFCFKKKKIFLIRSLSFLFYFFFFFNIFLKILYTFF